MIRTPIRTPLCAVALAALTLAQDRPVAGSGLIPVHFVSPADPVDVPAPPRSLSDVPRHGEPRLPVATGSRELPPGPECRPVDPAQIGPAAATVRVFRNTTVQVGSRSNVGEPTAVHNGSGALMTGNWYAATSDDDGRTWNHVNPYTKFPASDGGFCCDQYTHLVPHKNTAFWLLQYSYAASTQTGRHRIAVLRGAANLGSATVSGYYDVTPQIIGFPAGTWFDFPHMASSEQWLYVCSNVFDSSSNLVGAAVTRLDLDDMVAGRTASAQWRTDLTGSSFRFAAAVGPAPRMHFATHISTGALRIYSWDDGGAFAQHDRPVANWYSGTTNVAGPDGRFWTGRASNRILGAWDDSVHVGFMWYSNAGGTYPLPNVRVAWFDRDTLALVGERAIWSSVTAWAYPSVAANRYGHLGGTMAYGGGAYYPGTAAWIVDDLNCWGGFDNLVVAGGTHGPDGNRWGDYYSAQCDTLESGTWLATAMAQSGGSGNANQVPRNVDFGRDNPDVDLGLVDVRTAPIGVESAVTIDRTDNFCRAGATTPFMRSYRTGTPVTLTAEAAAGGRQFHRWVVDATSHPIGQRSITLTVGSRQLARAVYGRYTAGALTRLGVGCAGSNGVPDLDGADLPEIGRTVVYKLSRAPANGAALLVLGLSGTAWNGLPLPLLLPGTSCRIYTDLLTTFTVAANASGSALLHVPLPSDLSLIGGAFLLQGWCLDPGANALRLTTSNAVASWIGGWDLR